jgi:DNA-binding NtrC family response regulator
MELKVKKVLVLCEPNRTRGAITNVLKGADYNVIRVGNTIKALESLRPSGVADLVILGQNTNTDTMKEWLENNCFGIPIIIIVGCECESKKVAHTDNEIKASELHLLPALIESKIGPPKPLG